MPASFPTMAEHRELLLMGSRADATSDSLVFAGHLSFFTMFLTSPLLLLLSHSSFNWLRRKDSFLCL